MFYTYNQNNSGGSFVFEKSGISHFVIVEADSAEDADSKAQAIGLYFDGEGDCDCCGARWSQAYNGTNEPEVYGASAFDYEVSKFGIKWMGEDPEGFIHYRDGKIIPFYTGV